ncbi:hypothetical protein BC828DRAFT_397252 [Blastocladiella britannica]|nr:hypothetical protein BC828DRAFT_397252 [Blastocladiella britannica]
MLGFRLTASGLESPNDTDDLRPATEHELSLEVMASKLTLDDDDVGNNDAAAPALGRSGARMASRDADFGTRLARLQPQHQQYTQSATHLHIYAPAESGNGSGSPPDVAAAAATVSPWHQQPREPIYNAGMQGWADMSSTGSTVPRRSLSDSSSAPHHGRGGADRMAPLASYASAASRPVSLADLHELSVPFFPMAMAPAPAVAGSAAGMSPPVSRDSMHMGPSRFGSAAPELVMSPRFPTQTMSAPATAPPSRPRSPATASAYPGSPPPYYYQESDGDYMPARGPTGSTHHPMAYLGPHGGAPPVHDPELVASRTLDPGLTPHGRFTDLTSGTASPPAHQLPRHVYGQPQAHHQHSALPAAHHHPSLTHSRSMPYLGQQQHQQSQQQQRQQQRSSLQYSPSVSPPHAISAAHADPRLSLTFEDGFGSFIGQLLPPSAYDPPSGVSSPPPHATDQLSPRGGHLLRHRESASSLGSSYGVPFGPASPGWFGEATYGEPQQHHHPQQQPRPVSATSYPPLRSHHDRGRGAQYEPRTTTPYPPTGAPVLPIHISTPMITLDGREWMPHDVEHMHFIGSPMTHLGGPPPPPMREQPGHAFVRHGQLEHQGPLHPLHQYQHPALQHPSQQHAHFYPAQLQLQHVRTSSHSSSTCSPTSLTSASASSPMPPTLLPSLSALSMWAASRIHLHTVKQQTVFPVYLSILGGDQVEFNFGFSHNNMTGQPIGSGGVGAPGPSGAMMSAPYSTSGGSSPNGNSNVNGGNSGGSAASVLHNLAFVLVEQVSLAPKANELHVPTCTNAPNHLLSWTTVYAANSFGIYRLTPLQSHLLPLFVRPLVQYSERIINKEKMPHLILAVGEGGSGKTWSYLLGCIDYIVRGSHFQRGGLVSHGHQQQHHPQQHYGHSYDGHHPPYPSDRGYGMQSPYQGAPGGLQHGMPPYSAMPPPMSGMPLSLTEQHQLLLSGTSFRSSQSSPSGSPYLSGGGGSSNGGAGLGPKALILLPTKEAVLKMKKLLGDLATAITNSWLKSQDMSNMNMRQRPQRLVTYLAVVGNILKTRLAKQLNDHDIVVGMPSSIRELVEANKLRLDAVKYLIVDEITRVHEHTGVQQLADDICAVVGQLPPSTKSHSIKTVLYSRHWNSNVQYIAERVAAVFQVVPPSPPPHSGASAPSAGIPLSATTGPGPSGSPQSLPPRMVDANGRPIQAGGTRSVPSSHAPLQSHHPQPTSCESYLKIVACPKAYSHTLFPRPCLAPLAQQIMRSLAHIPHHFVACADSGRPTPSSRFEVLMDVILGQHQYEPHAFALPSPSVHERVHAQSQSSRPSPADTPPMSASASPQLLAAGHPQQQQQHQQQRPLGVIVMANSRQEAAELHAALAATRLGPITHFVVPETLESTLVAVRCMGLHSGRGHFGGSRPTSMHGAGSLASGSNGISNSSATGKALPVSLTPPMSQSSSPTLTGQQGPTDGAPPSSNSPPGPQYIRQPPPTTTAAAASNNSQEPVLVLVTVRPDSTTGNWMLDLKATCQDLSYMVINAQVPETVDDYYLSLLTHVSPHVSHGVDASVKMSLAVNKLPLRQLPVSVVTMYAPGPTDFGSGMPFSTDFMPQTEADRVALLRCVAAAIAQSR